AYTKDHAAPCPRSAALPPPPRGCQHSSSRYSVILPGPRLREFLLSPTNMCPCNKSPLLAQKNSYCNWHVWKQIDLPERGLRSQPAFRALHSCHSGVYREPQRPAVL